MYAGVRTAAFVSGGILPARVRGTTLTQVRTTVVSANHYVLLSPIRHNTVTMTPSRWKRTWQSTIACQRQGHSFQNSNACVLLSQMIHVCDWYRTFGVLAGVLPSQGILPGATTEDVPPGTVWGGYLCLAACLAVFDCVPDCVCPCLCIFGSVGVCRCVCVAASASASLCASARMCLCVCV